MDIASLVKVKRNTKIPDIAPGDTVKVSARIKEGGKERIQVFQGVVIKLRRGGHGASFTVRHVASGIGVERTFPFASPLVEKVDIVRHGKVKRAKLYYLRNLSGKAARRKIKQSDKVRRSRVEEEILEEAPALEPEAEEQALVEAEAAAEPEAKAEPVEEAVAEPEAKAEAAPEAEAVAEPEAKAEPVAEAEAEKAPESEKEA